MKNRAQLLLDQGLIVRQGLTQVLGAGFTALGALCGLPYGLVGFAHARVRD